jgi:hypothetical protein
MKTSLPEAPSWIRSRSGITLLAFLAIAAFLVVTEHTAHALGILPYLLLLACPLLHFFHGGHGRGHGGQGGDHRIHDGRGAQ